jgi:hypothetical protein
MMLLQRAPRIDLVAMSGLRDGPAPAGPASGQPCDEKFIMLCDRKETRQLFRQLAPKAKRLAREFKTELVDSTAVADSFLAVGCKPVGVHVYPAELGGWHADIIFGNVPPGMPNTIGTPATLPCATRKEALDRAVMMLAAIFAARTRSKPAVPDEVIFELYGVNCAFRAASIATLAKAALPDVAPAAWGRLLDTELLAAGELVHAADYVPEIDRLPQAVRRRLGKIMAAALAHGVFRHPMPVPASPSGHAMSATMH